MVFLSEMRPMLDLGDKDLLASFVGERFSNDYLIDLLSCGNSDAVKVSLLCLSYTGTLDEQQAVAALLHHEDPMVVQLADQALWSIWFRACEGHGHATLLAAVHLISENNIPEAERMLTGMIERCPDFAEAYNQRAICRFLREDYTNAIADCKSTLARCPLHFGAMAGMAHSYAALGQIDEALAVYDAVLRIHPTLDGIAESIAQLKSCSKLDHAHMQQQS